VLAMLGNLIIFLTPAENIDQMVFIAKTGTGRLGKTD